MRLCDEPDGRLKRSTRPSTAKGESWLRLFVDSGPFIALHFKDDLHHGDAVDSFAKLARREARYKKLYTSDYVLDEAITTCRVRTKSHELSVRLGTDILSSKSLVLLGVDEKVREEAWRLYKERGDVNLSFTDATCATLAKTHGIPDIFTYNAREFRPLNFNVVASI